MQSEVLTKKVYWQVFGFVSERKIPHELLRFGLVELGLNSIKPIKGRKK